VPSIAVPSYLLDLNCQKFIGGLELSEVLAQCDEIGQPRVLISGYCACRLVLSNQLGFGVATDYKRAALVVSDQAIDHPLRQMLVKVNE
jgi:hypothetical protein